MELQIKGHAAIVQGASKGIGRGIGEALAREGCDLLLTARTGEALEATAAEIAEAHGVRVLHDPADSGELDDNARLVERVREEFGRLDILVCNSGGPPPGGAMELDAEAWRNAAELLVVAPVDLLRRAMPLMEGSPAPRFFVVTSSSTREPVNGLALSNTFRPGLVGLVKTLASELASRRVRCHAISPGRIDTDRLDAVIAMQAKRANVKPEQIRGAMLAAIPAGRFGEPADLGALVAFLASPVADYLTGGNWLVDGGLIKAL